jgi:hypothetical protein
MKIAIEPTSKIVTLEIGGAAVPARIWEGYTDQGTAVHCFITRICPTIPEPLPENVLAEFAASLKECAKPSVGIQGIPLRLIL